MVHYCTNVVFITYVVEKVLHMWGMMHIYGVQLGRYK